MPSMNHEVDPHQTLSFSSWSGHSPLSPRAPGRPRTASGWAPGMGVGVGSDQTDRTKMRLPERVCRFKARAQLGLPAQPHRLTWGVPGARLQKQHRVAVTPSPAPCPRQAEPGPLKGATLTPTCCPRGQTAGTLCPRPSWRTV